MTSTFISDSAWYWPVVCFLAALALTAVSYYRNSRLQDLGVWKLRLLAALRFLALFVTGLLLLNIFVRRNTTHTEKPVLALAFDNSESILMRGPYAADSLRGIRDGVAGIMDHLSNKYNVKLFAFGDKVRMSDAGALDFSDKYTDMSQMMESMQALMGNANSGALVVLSDGICNRGQNPVYSTSAFPNKIHTVLLGDTTAYKDLLIGGTVFNETAFLGNEFPIQVTVNARMLAGQNTSCEISRNGRVEFSKNISISSDNFSQEISTSLKADTKGLNKYTITLRSLDGEITTLNNTRDILVDVVDDKHKVLILSAMPHPDVAALRNALGANRGLDVDVATIQNFDKSVSGYNLVVLVQLPAVNHKADKVLSEIRQKGIPALFVVGSQTDFDKLNEVNTCVSISKKSDSFEEVGYAENARFSLLTFENGVEEMLQKAPPLYCAFGEYKVLPQTQVFGNQLIKGVATDKPLVAISEPGKSRQAVITGEGIWRWRIDCYKRYLNHEKFDLMISRICQFLLTRTDKERFVVSTRSIFNENEPVYLNAKVLDESMELDNEAEVTVDLVPQSNPKNTFSGKMEPTGSGYYIRVDNLEPDAYTYTAKAVSNGKTLSKSGVFSIKEIKTEAENLVANSGLMRKIASQTGGRMFAAGQMSDLEKALLDDDDIRPTSYSDVSTVSLMSFKWLFALIVLLLSAEWFLRKFWGTL
ncbi:MAG: hypothetical protein MJZ66_03080 [Bacteroidales bacterium]|nr:hypothetical protein [Bacteroidales bacterium]